MTRYYAYIRTLEEPVFDTSQSEPVPAGTRTVTRVHNIETIDGEPPLEQRFHPAIVADMIDITGLEPRPAEGWHYDRQAGVFTPLDAL